MPRDEIAWKLMQENAEKLDGMCLLCYWKIPGGWGLATQVHHIAPKQMGGTNSEFVLKDVRNMAPTCLPHHNKHQANRRIWMELMSLSPLNHKYRGVKELAKYMGDSLDAES